MIKHAGFSLFPVIARGVRELGVSQDFVEHDRLVSWMLTDPEASAHLAARASVPGESKSPAWFAGNAVAFFAREWSLGRNPWVAGHERTRVAGKWAYRSGPSSTVSTRRIIVGDIHGSPDALTEILLHAGLIDGAHVWIAANTVLIQTGDVIDRGPDSLGAVALLRTLQAQAAAHGSRVVRCCGNHELMLLQRDVRYVDVSDPKALADQFRHEISQGLLQAAYTDGSRLYTHAGLRTVVQDTLVEEIKRAHPSDDARSTSLEALADHINTVFRTAVAEDRCDSTHHCIFWVDDARGGADEVGGLFWCHYPDLAGSVEAWRVAQVFGHTPSRRSGLDHDRGLTLINVDAGMCKVYGGHTVYLEITSAGEVVQHSKGGANWRRTLLEASGRTARP